jgi:MFS family permease
VVLYERGATNQGDVEARIRRALFGVALVASFAQFGAVAALNDVATHFGSHPNLLHINTLVGLKGSQIALGLAILRLASLGSLAFTSHADRTPRPKILKWVLYVGLLLTGLAALSPSYWVFVLLFALARPLFGAASALAQIMTSEHSHGHRVGSMAVLTAGTGIGAGLAAVLHGAVRGPNSFRWLFALALVPLFIMPLVLRPLRSVVSSQKSDARLGAVPRELRKPVLTLSLVAFAVGIIGGPANGFAVVYGEGVCHIQPSSMSLIILLCALTGLGGLWVGSRLSKRIGLKRTLVLTILSVALMATIAYGGSKPQFIVGYLIGMGMSGAMSPVLATLATQVFPKRNRATCAGWIVVAGVLGAVFGLELFGYIVDSWHGNFPWRMAALITFWPELALLTLLPRINEEHRH